MATRTARQRPKSTASQTSVITKHNGAKQALPESEDRYRALFDRSPDAVYIHDLEGNFLDANDAALRLLGYTRDEIRELSFADLLDVSQLPTALAVLQEIMESGYQAKPTMFKLKRKDGTLVEVETVAAVITNGGQSVAIQGIARDITERRRMEERLQKAKEELEHRVAERTADLERLNAELRREVTERERSESLLAGQTQVLAILARGAPLEEALDAIVRMIEERADGMLCSVLLVHADERVLRPGAAPSLPDAFNQAVAQGIPIGPNTGSCGTAAYRAEPVISADIANDPIWVDYRELALGHGLRACWSTPIFSSAGEVSGTFAMYYHQPRSPGPLDQELIRVATHVAGIAIERGQAEEALRLQSDILQNIAEAVYLIRGSDGVIVYTNPSFEQMFGYDPDELVGKHVSVVNAPTGKSPEETAKEIIVALDRTGVWRGEILNIKKDGTTFWCQANVSEFDHPRHGRVWATYHTDITTRKQAEEALRESEERYRALYTKTPAMVHSLDTDGNLLAVSDRWLEVLGYERNEVIGRKGIEFLTAELRQYAETVTLPELWKTGSARDVACQVVKKNGEIVDVLVSAVVERDLQGNVVRTVGILDDITERKRLEEELRQAREALEGKVERQMVHRNPYGLTFREFTVLHHVAAGKADKQIAHELGISPLTVHKHVANILSKMNAASRTEAGVRALREGLVD